MSARDVQNKWARISNDDLSNVNASATFDDGSDGEAIQETNQTFYVRLSLFMLVSVAIFMAAVSKLSNPFSSQIVPADLHVIERTRGEWIREQGHYVHMHDLTEKLSIPGVPNPSDQYSVLQQPVSVDDAPSCQVYMQGEGCQWTVQWNCPGQSGGEGLARPSGLVSYKCCCEQDLWKKMHFPVLNRMEKSTSFPSEFEPDTSDQDVVHNYMTVYHQTSPENCRRILQDNFRIGHGGWCGKAIYFTRTPEATKTKAIAASGCMIEAHIDVGVLLRFKTCGMYNSMTPEKLREEGGDSIVFDPGSGDEILVFDVDRVLSKKIIPFNRDWNPRIRR